MLDSTPIDRVMRRVVVPLSRQSEGPIDRTNHAISIMARFMPERIDRCGSECRIAWKARDLALDSGSVKTYHDRVTATLAQKCI